jgi:hypothetical protein
MEIRDLVEVKVLRGGAGAGGWGRSEKISKAERWCKRLTEGLGGTGNWWIKEGEISAEEIHMLRGHLGLLGALGCCRAGSSNANDIETKHSEV